MIQEATTERCRKNRADDPFHADRPCRNMFSKPTSRARVPAGVTPGGHRLGETLKIAKLQQQVGQLKKLVSDLIQLIDPEEVAAAKRLRVISPSNDQLRAWAAGYAPPPESATIED